jgi:hypothetical protein
MWDGRWFNERALIKYMFFKPKGLLGWAPLWNSLRVTNFTPFPSLESGAWRRRWQLAGCVEGGRVGGNYHGLLPWIWTCWALMSRAGTIVASWGDCWRYHHQYLLLEEGQTAPWVSVDEKNDCRPLSKQWRANNNTNQVQVLSDRLQKSEIPIRCVLLLTSVTTNVVSFASFSIKNRAVLIIMVFKCCVPKCNGNSKNGPKVSVFRFPRIEEMKRKLLRAIHRADFQPTQHSRVCLRFNHS